MFYVLYLILEHLRKKKKDFRGHLVLASAFVGPKVELDEALKE